MLMANTQSATVDRSVHDTSDNDINVNKKQFPTLLGWEWLCGCAYLRNPSFSINPRYDSRLLWLR
jgi:hypothetical protein